jgi:DNA-binding transcriptional ArsR family regulator
VVTYESVLDALGHPTRRAIFELVVEQPRPVAEIARWLPVTRPAVSQHLKVLRDAGLVTHRTEGTRHVYAADRVGIAALRDHLDRHWERALANFKDTVEAEAEEQP